MMLTHSSVKPEFQQDAIHLWECAQYERKGAYIYAQLAATEMAQPMHGIKGGSINLRKQILILT